MRKAVFSIQKDKNALIIRKDHSQKLGFNSSSEKGSNNSHTLTEKSDDNYPSQEDVDEADGSASDGDQSASQGDPQEKVRRPNTRQGQLRNQSSEQSLNGHFSAPNQKKQKEASGKTSSEEAEAPQEMDENFESASSSSD